MKHLATALVCGSLLLSACSDSVIAPKDGAVSVLSPEAMAAGTSNEPIYLGTGQSLVLSRGATARNRWVLWNSSDTTIATVGSSGVVNGRRVGRVIISSTDGDAVHVEVVSTDPFELSPETPTIAVGDSTQLTANSTAALTWQSSDPTVATVSATGKVAALRIGSTTVSASTRVGTSASTRLTVATSSTTPPVTPPPPGSTPVTPPPPSNTPTTPPPVLPPFGSPVQYNAPAPPQAFVDVTYPAVTGTTRRVEAGQSLQAALDAAQPGDEVVLASGATFTGNFVLPKKTSGSGWIIVRAEQVGSSLGTRITPAQVAGQAIVKSPNSEAAIRTAQGASKYRLVGFEVTQATGLEINYGLVVLGNGDRTDATLDQMPSQIVLDRMYIHGTLVDQLKRCVAFNGISLAVVDSWLSECHGKGFDSQGVAGWNGPGPFLIENNRIEGAGQAVMFGGSDPSISGLSPSDIVIRRNHMYKPTSWANGKWEVKATFELKHARRVLFERNVLENHWIDAQVGFAILFQAISQYGGAPWTMVDDVLIQDNIIKNSTAGINLLSRSSDVSPTQGTSRIAIVNNLFQNVGADPVAGTKSTIIQLLSDLSDVSIINNTAVLAGASLSVIAMDYRSQARLTVVNNVLPLSDYGFIGSGIGAGTAALAHYAPGAVVMGNVFPGQLAYMYPANNFFPALSSTISFQFDFGLSEANSFSTGVFGRIGVDGARLSAATAGVN